MKNKKERSLLDQAKAEGYCIAHVAIILNILLTQVSEQEIQEKCFAYIKQFAPEVTWEEYRNSVNDPMRGFMVEQKMFPELTEEMYREILESRKDEYDTVAYVESHLEIFRDSALWKQADEQFDTSGILVHKAAFKKRRNSL